jgi:glutathione synthase/RimK-type ligase-like ATP-grasp enzyme
VHHQGRNLVYAKTQQELEDGYYQLRELGDVYISEFIPKEREYRIYVVQGRVAMVAEKTPADPGAIAWNHHLGGSFENVRWKEWPRAACLEGIKACVALGLDFGGIDVITDGEGTPYVLEGNSAPSMTSEYRQQCFAKVFNYIRKNGKERIQLTKQPKDRKSIYPYIIHPAVAEEAK